MERNVYCDITNPGGTHDYLYDGPHFKIKKPPELELNINRRSDGTVTTRRPAKGPDNYASKRDFLTDLVYPDQRFTEPPDPPQ